jgi:hypothetical protein
MKYVKTTADQWLFTELESESATLFLNTIDVQISLPEIYEKVYFADSNDEE